MILKYFIASLVLFCIFFIYCHITKITTANNNLDIIQLADPDPEIFYDLLQKNQPIILQKELYCWKHINKLLNSSLTDIKIIINNTKDTTTTGNASSKEYTTSIKENLSIFNLPLSYDWNIDIQNIILDDKSGIFFIKQSHLLQCFACITGEFRIIIVPNDQRKFLEPFKNNVSTINATAILDKVPMEMNFIEIIIRTGNLIYIPYGWHYFIYKPHIDKETVIMNCINSTLLNYFIMN